ncbi:MAG: hypothetical protein H8E66_21905 [Planctomycetes bacterium]|nr:hypothetical protein [Planctomycetota bacterium]
MNTVNVTTIICSDCGAELAATAATCQHCGGATANQPPNASKEKLKQLLDRPWVIVVLLLHVGLLGIPVYWKTNYSVATRLLIVVASIVYTAGAVGFIVMMLRWLISLVFGG